MDFTDVNETGPLPQCFRLQNCRSINLIFNIYFFTVLCKCFNMLHVKIPGEQHFIKYSNQPVRHQQHAKVKVTEIAFSHILLLDVNITGSS